MSMINIYNYILTKLTPEHFIQYDLIIKDLHQASHIKQYAAGVIQDIVQEYSLKVTSKTDLPITKYLIIGVGIVVLICGACVIINYFLPDLNSIIGKSAEVAHEIAKAGLSTTVNIKENNINHINLIEEVIKLTTQVGEINHRMDHMQRWIVELAKLVKFNHDILHKLDPTKIPPTLIDTNIFK